MKSNIEYAAEYFHMANDNYNKGQYELAINTYDMAIVYNPGHAETYYNKGKALSALGLKQLALDCYNKALELNPNDDRIYHSKALTLYIMGNIHDAISTYDMAIKFNPNNANAYYHKGGALYVINNVKEAIEAYNMAIKLNPNYEKVYYDRGIALYSIGKTSETIKSYEMVIKLNPDNADAYIGKGIALSDMGNAQGAINSYDKASKLDSDDAKYYYNKAKVLSNMEHEQEALYWFNKAYKLTIKPTNVAADLNVENTYSTDQHTVNNKGNLLKQIAKLQEVTVDAQKLVDNLDHNNPTVKSAVEKFRALKHHKTIITNKIMDSFDNPSSSPTVFSNRINGDLQKEIIVLQEQIRKEHEEMLLLQSVQNRQSKDIELVKYQLNDLADGVRNMKLIVESAGILDKVKVKDGFAELYQQSPKLYEYAKAFYWTLLNYFAAYRSIGTNLVTGNTDTVSSDPEKFMVTGLESVSSYLVDMAVETTKSIPIVGNIIGLLDGVVSDIY